MARSTAEWIGKDDNTPIPDRVRLRVWDRCKGLCHRCGRKIRGAIEKWVCEHLIALINWRATDEAPHGNREGNLGLTCENCVAPKNAEDVAEKAEVAATRKAFILPKPLSTWGAGRGSKWKKKLSGETIRR